jgi:hypothetical protein
MILINYFREKNVSFNYISFLIGFGKFAFREKREPALEVSKFRDGVMKQLLHSDNENGSNRIRQLISLIK